MRFVNEVNLPIIASVIVFAISAIIYLFKTIETTIIVLFKDFCVWPNLVYLFIEFALSFKMLFIELVKYRKQNPKFI